MVRFGQVKRMVSSILAEVKGLGGVTQNRMVSLKGLYSKPLRENAIVIPLSKGNNQDVIFVLQKEVENLKDGDVYLTDDKSYIHFHFNGDSIEVKTKKIEFNVSEFIVNATTAEFNGCTVKNDGIPIDKTHTHPTGHGGDTEPPNS
jgi:hypothetical protein